MPERWIDLFAIAGTPAEVRARLEAAVQTGAEEISMILMAPSSGARGGADQLSLFAETVMQPMQGPRGGGVGDGSNTVQGPEVYDSHTGGTT